MATFSLQPERSRGREWSYIADTYEHADSVEKVTAVKRVA